MEVSILIARIICVIYLSAGLGFLFSRKYYDKLLDNMFKKNPGLTFLTGFFTIIIASLIVSYHNIWVWKWTVLITIIGWIGLVKGILILAFPELMYKISKPIMKGAVFKAFPYLALVLGLLFGYLGFFA